MSKDPKCIVCSYLEFIPSQYTPSVALQVGAVGADPHPGGDPHPGDVWYIDMWEGWRAPSLTKSVFNDSRYSSMSGPAEQSEYPEE